MVRPQILKKETMVICIFLMLVGIFALGFYFGNSWGKFSANEDKKENEEQNKATQ